MNLRELHEYHCESHPVPHRRFRPSNLAIQALVEENCVIVISVGHSPAVEVLVFLNEPHFEVLGCLRLNPPPALRYSSPYVRFCYIITETLLAFRPILRHCFCYITLPNPIIAHFLASRNLRATRFRLHNSIIPDRFCFAAYFINHDNQETFRTYSIRPT